jgi:hypothetical protein
LKKKKVPSFARLSKRKDFDTILNLLNDVDVEAPIIEKWFEREYTLTGENCLHFVMRSKPPANVVSAMIRRLQGAGITHPELSVDLTGRTALHHACMWLCEPSVVHSILQTSAGAISARAKDLEGRLPLHYAVRPKEVVTKLGSRKAKGPKTNPELIEAITTMEMNVKLLVGLSPRTSCVADGKKCTPIDYLNRLVIVNETYQTMIKNIQLELDMSMDLCKTTSTFDERKSGMVIKFSNRDLSTDTDGIDDDVSVLSFNG